MKKPPSAPRHWAGTRTQSRGRFVHVVAGAFAALVLFVGDIPSPTAAQSVESTYKVAGRWAVTASSVINTSGSSYDLWYPANLGAEGFRHPVVAWANGTLTPTGSYARLLQHLASWGFVVVATTHTWTGSGDAVLAAVNDLRSKSQDPAHAFYDRVDPTRVGAMGHSQGAYGALNAMLKSNGVIGTAVPINLPDMIWVSPSHVADLTRLTQPVFFVGGGADWLSTTTGLAAYVEQIPGAVAAALLTGASHDAVKTQTDAYLGYVTAWLMYQLQGDPHAAGAFEGTGAEITSNSSWRLVLPLGSGSESPLA